MDQDMREVLTRAAVDVPLAGRMLGISKNTAYRAVRDGSLPAVKVAGQFRVPTAKLREMLGIPSADPKAA